MNLMVTTSFDQLIILPYFLASIKVCTTLLIVGSQPPLRLQLQLKASTQDNKAGAALDSLTSESVPIPPPHQNQPG